MRKLIYLVAIACICYSPSLLAQEQIGLRLDKYAGVNGIQLNPGNGANHPLSWDLNLAGAGIFIENNFVFASPTNLIHLAKNPNDLYFMDPTNENNSSSNASIIVDYFNGPKDRMLQTTATVLGPSLMVNFKGKHSLGVFSEFNVSLGGFDIDRDINPYDLSKIEETGHIDIERFQMSAMAWAEYGIHYSYGTEMYLGKVSFGGNFKMLRGYEALYLDVAQPIVASRDSNNVVEVSDINVSFGFTNKAIETASISTKPIGSGYALDLGATWLFNVNEENGYRYKLGISILDLGKINFTKWTENYNIVSNGVNTNIDTAPFENLTTKEEVLDELSNQVLGSNTSIRAPAGISMWAPTTLSIQGDFQITKGVFVAGLLNQRITFSKVAVKRNNTFALFPRIEKRWYSLGFPIVINNWQDFRLGTTARIGFLTVGSDNIGSLVGKSTLTGTDLYFALKFNPFDINLFGNKGKPKGQPIKCYKF